MTKSATRKQATTPRRSVKTRAPIDKRPDALLCTRLELSETDFAALLGCGFKTVYRWSEGAEPGGLYAIVIQALADGVRRMTPDEARRWGGEIKISLAAAKKDSAAKLRTLTRMLTVALYGRRRRRYKKGSRARRRHEPGEPMTEMERVAATLMADLRGESPRVLPRGVPIESPRVRPRAVPIRPLE